MKRAGMILAGFMLAAGIVAPGPSALAGETGHKGGVAHAHRSSAPGASRVLAPRDIQDFCSSNGFGYCMNDWNGNHNQGAAIKMYYGGSSNEQFEVQPINPCNSNPADEVTQTCPFVVGSGLNDLYQGGTIFQLYYPAANLCLGTVTGTGSNAGNGILTGCNNSAGSGGGFGTVLIGPENTQADITAIIDRYWTNLAPSDVTAWVCGTGFENPLTMASSSFSSACQWENS